MNGNISPINKNNKEKIIKEKNLNDTTNQSNEIQIGKNFNKKDNKNIKN